MELRIKVNVEERGKSHIVTQNVSDNTTLAAFMGQILEAASVKPANPVFVLPRPYKVFSGVDSTKSLKELEIKSGTYLSLQSLNQSLLVPERSAASVAKTSAPISKELKSPSILVKPSIPSNQSPIHTIHDKSEQDQRDKMRLQINKAREEKNWKKVVELQHFKKVSFAHHTGGNSNSFFVPSMIDPDAIFTRCSHNCFTGVHVNASKHKPDQYLEIGSFVTVSKKKSHTHSCVLIGGGFLGELTIVWLISPEGQLMDPVPLSNVSSEFKFNTDDKWIKEKRQLIPKELSPPIDKTRTHSEPVIQTVIEDSRLSDVIDRVNEVETNVQHVSDQVHRLEKKFEKKDKKTQPKETTKKLENSVSNIRNENKRIGDELQSMKLKIAKLESLNNPPVPNVQHQVPIFQVPYLGHQCQTGCSHCSQTHHFM